MKYLIDEVELIKLLKEFRSDHRLRAESFAEYFLKTKKSVEMVTSGKLRLNPLSYTYLVGGISLTAGNSEERQKLTKVLGRNTKIYIQKSK